MQNIQKDHMVPIAEFIYLKILQAGLRMFMYVIFVFLVFVLCTCQVNMPMQLALKL